MCGETTFPFPNFNRTPLKFRNGDAISTEFQLVCDYLSMLRLKLSHACKRVSELYTLFSELTVHRPKLPDSQLRCPDNGRFAIGSYCYLRQVQSSKLMRHTQFRLIDLYGNVCIKTSHVERVCISWRHLPNLSSSVNSVIVKEPNNKHYYLILLQAFQI